MFILAMIGLIAFVLFSVWFNDLESSEKEKFYSSIGYISLFAGFLVFGVVVFIVS